jgi:hypothetical protein
MEIMFTKTGLDEDIFSCKRIRWNTDMDARLQIFHSARPVPLCSRDHLVIKKGFLGMLANGTDITDFGLPKKQRTIELTSETLFAEHLVNLIVIDYTQAE